MNKKLIVTSLAIMAGLTTFSATNAFLGGQGEGQEGRRGGMHRMEMTQERFDEMKAMFNKYTNVADFAAAREEIRETRKAEHEAMKESVTKSVEKITNGIIVTVTSDDAAIVEKIQSREERDPKNEDITKTVETISNGVRMTITSDDEDLVEKIQAREERNGEGKMGKRGGQKRGERGGRAQVSE